LNVVTTDRFDEFLAATTETESRFSKSSSSSAS
jgi:hypothetical protein